MSDPFIVAICPTFRRPKLIPNVLAMWDAQTYPADRRHLIILDDGGSFESQHGSNWELISLLERMPTLGGKFRRLAEHALTMAADIIALWEDDDVYLPWYLESHEQALRRGDISQPWAVLSNDKDGWGTSRKVGAQGRFHGSWAFQADCYEQSDGYPANGVHDFDMRLNGALRRTGGVVVDTFEGREPGYLYRWQTTGYSNGSGWGKTMYESTERCHKPERVEGRIVPQFDDETAHYYKELTDGISSAEVERSAG
mgnify:CR=1 FL=1